MIRLTQKKKYDKTNTKKKYDKTNTKKNMIRLTQRKNMIRLTAAFGWNPRNNRKKIRIEK